ncbi:MAG: hypothetical protein J6V33_05780, partial [Bacteroidales bacterium]|nr:hypothetical protein [Bacteroidales bacterium]
MQTSSTSPTQRGTNIKQEQRSVCSNIQQTTQTLARRAGTGIAKQLMLLWLFVFTLVGGTAWGQTETVTVTNRSEDFECGKTYNVSATTVGTYTFTNTTGSPITISGITVNTLRSRASNSNNYTSYDAVIINNTEYSINGIEYSLNSCGNYKIKGTTYDTYEGTGTVSSITIANNASATFQISKRVNDGNAVTNCDPTGFSFTVTTPPCCPGTPTLTAPDDRVVYAKGTTDGIDLSWNNVNYANGYTVTVTDAAGNTISDANVEGNTTSSGNYNLNLDLSNYSTGIYTWTVTPTSEQQHCNPQGASRTFYVVGKPILKPVPNAVLNNGSASVTLEWNKITGVSSYEVNVTGPNSYSYSTTTNNNVTSTSLNITTLSGSGQYTWTVTPKDKDDNSLTSLASTSTFVVMEKECPTLIAPKDNAVLNSPSSIEFSWEAYTGANNYTLNIDDATTRITKNINADDANVTVNNNTVTYTYNPTTPLAAGVYTWKVVPNNYLNCEYYCPANTFTVGSVSKTYTIGSGTNSGTYTVHDGVDYVIIEAIGGGGAGGSVEAPETPEAIGAAGGGGGAYSRVQVSASKIKNRTLTYIVGAGGTNNGTDGGNGGTNNGTDGGNGGTTEVTFTYNSTDYTLTANGGYGAAVEGDNASAGGTPTTTTDFGIIKDANYRSYAGGKGADGTSSFSGGGGGAAGSKGKGYNASQMHGGAANSPGGKGADGSTENSTGTTCENYGGGGSGAYYSSGENSLTGGAGAPGAVIITEYIYRANPDTVSRGSNIESMEIDVIANDFVPGDNYTISIVGTTSNGTATVTNDKKVLFTFPQDDEGNTVYNSDNSSFEYIITSSDGGTETSINRAKVTILNSSVVANLGCPEKQISTSGSTQDIYKFPNVNIIGNENIRYMSVALTNVPDISEESTYSIKVTNTHSGTSIVNTGYMWAYHFTGDGITLNDAKDLIADIEVGIPTGGEDEDFVGVSLEISTTYDGRDVIYNAENGHYYELIKYQNGDDISWLTAYQSAKNRTYLGMQGYLATITSLEEDRFMTALVNAPGWLGGTRWSHGEEDEDNPLFYEGFEGTTSSPTLKDFWYWACGPEKGYEVGKFMNRVKSGATYSNPTTNTPQGTFDADDSENETARKQWYDSYMLTNKCYFNWGIGCSEATGGPEPNNDGPEYCLSVLKNKGFGCSFYDTKFENFSWNDLRNNPGSGYGWNPEGYIIEYGDRVIGNSFPPEHDWVKCRAIVGLRQETVTANVAETKVVCKNGKDSLEVKITFEGGLPPYEFDIYEGNKYVSSYSTRNEIYIYLPIERDANTYTIKNFISGTITGGVCNTDNSAEPNFEVKGEVKGEGENQIITADITVPAELSWKIEENCAGTELTVTVSGGHASQYPLTVAISPSTTTTTTPEIGFNNGSGGSIIFPNLNNENDVNYTITITPKNNNDCVKTDEYLLAKEVTFSAGRITGNTAVCQGATMPTITDAQDNPATGRELGFQWYVEEQDEDPTTGPTAINGATERTYIPSSEDEDLDPGTYEYTRKVKNFCDANSAWQQSDGSYTLIVRANPIVTIQNSTGEPITGREITICEGSSITLIGSANESGLEYKWTKGSVDLGDSDITITEEDIYVFTATKDYGDYECSADASVDIKVADPIQVGITVNEEQIGDAPATICEGEYNNSVTLTASYNGDKEGDERPEYEYTLRKEGYTESITGEVTETGENEWQIQPTPGTYILEVASVDGAENTICTASIPVLTVYAKPVVEITCVDNTICEGGSTELTASVSNTEALGNATSYVWYEGGTEESDVISGATVASLPLSSLDAGTHNYYVKANVTHGEGESADVCTSEIYGPYTVTVYALPTVSIEGD